MTRLWWQSLLVLAAFITLVGLGTWQIERKAWKEALIEALAERTNAQPVPLPAAERWPMLDPAQDEFRRVAFAATIAPEREALVYSSGSSVRPDVSGPGYWVFAPAELVGGGTVMVIRGFLPEGQQDRKTHVPPTGRLELVGALRWPEPRSWFAPNDDPAHSLWFVRDHLAMAQAWGKVAPFYLDLETSTGPLPRAGRLTPTLRNEHLQYALTWYGLAIVLAAVFAFWLKSRWRDGRGQVG